MLNFRAILGRTENLGIQTLVWWVAQTKIWIPELRINNYKIMNNN